MAIRYSSDAQKILDKYKINQPLSVQNSERQKQGQFSSDAEAILEKYGVAGRNKVSIPQVQTPAGSSSVADLLPNPNDEAAMRNYAAQMQQKTPAGLTESEFNRSSAMQEKYGSYRNYLNSSKLENLKKSSYGESDTPRIDTSNVTHSSGNFVNVEDMNPLQRVWNSVKRTFSGGLKNSLGSNVNTQGVAYQGGQNIRNEYYNDQMAQYQKELDSAIQRQNYMKQHISDGQFTQEDVDAEQNYIDYYNMMLGAYGTGLAAQEGATKETYKLADKITENAGKDIQSAKDTSYGGKFGEMLVDAGASTVQSSADALASMLLTGQNPIKGVFSGAPVAEVLRTNAANATHTMAPFVVRAFGGGAQKARQEMEAKGTANDENAFAKQVAYGVADAAKEWITEKLGGIGAGGVYADADGFLDEFWDLVGEGFAESLTKSAAGRRIISGVTSAFVGEGAEEAIGDYLDYIFSLSDIYGGADESLIKDWKAGNGLGEKAKNVARGLANKLYDATEDFVVGGLSGVMGGAAKVANEITGTAAVGRDFRNMGVQNAQDFIDTGLESLPGTESRQLAQLLQQKQDAGKNISNYELGRLYNANVEAIDAENNAREELIRKQNRGNFTQPVEQTANTTRGNIVLPTAAERGMMPTYAQSTELNAVVQQAKETGEVTSGMVERVMKSPAMMQEIGMAQNARGSNARAEVKSRLESLANTENRDIIDNNGIANQNQQKIVENNAENTGNRFTAVSNAAEEVANNGGEQSVGGERWQRSLAAAEQSESVAGFQTEAGNVREGKSDGRSAVPADYRSGVNLGIETAVDADEDTTKTLREVTEYNDDQKAIVSYAKKKGQTVRFYTGDLWVKDTPDGIPYRVRGLIHSDGKTIWIKADHSAYSAKQIYMHEDFHAAVMQSRKVLDEGIKRIKRKYANDPAGLRRLIDSYVERYHIDDTNLSDEYILEEILADAHAGIDVETKSRSGEKETVDFKKAADKAIKKWSKAAEGKTSTAKKSVETLPDGKKYVKADRQVIFGNDIDSWKEQVENYINGKIRKGENVQLIDANGDALVLTATSASKLSSYYDGRGKTLDENEYETKANAAVHIDELVSVSKADGKPPKGDKGERHGDFASTGWKYRTAFFRDFDNKYYKLTISAALGTDGQIVYNIGKIEERPFPEISGSSAKGGAVEEGSSTDKDTKKSKESQDKISEPKLVSKETEKKYGVESIDGSVVKKSRETWEKTDTERLQEDLVKAGYTEDESKKWIADVNSVSATIAADQERLDYEAADNHTMLKTNQDYYYTLDASTLCAKRLLYQGTFDAVSHRLGNEFLSSDDVIDLRKMMADSGYEVPCGICYVESRRRHLGKYAKQWVDSYKGEYVPTVDEVTTTDGLENLRKTHPKAYKDFMDAMAKKGSANPKVVELRAAYSEEDGLMNLTKKEIENIIRIGGMRIQSFSDFETPHLIDTMQAVLDMTRRNLTSQAYTKVPNFAWVFGNTGIKINLSLIGDVDANGNLTFDNKEGINYDEAMKLRKAYSKNVGTILVGKSDAHIRAAMKSKVIDYIIPFHRSGWGQAEYQALGLTGYSDYTALQSEVSADYGTLDGGQFYPIDYWDYSVNGNRNARTYLEKCMESGRLPKFLHLAFSEKTAQNFAEEHPEYGLKVEDLTTAEGMSNLYRKQSNKRNVAQAYFEYALENGKVENGYWKMLIDFKMYDNSGNGAPQETVRADFNMKEANRVLSEYKGGANELPVAQDIVDKFVEKKQKSARTRYSLDMVDPVQPKSDAWERGATTDEVREAHPTLYAVDEEATEERNPTQVKGTIGSYRKVYNILRDEGFNGTILDASSGLGYGTEAGRSEYGFNVDDIEPYPDSDYNPKYTDYSKLKKKYDVIISNAVLNVIPQDQRDALVVKMGQLLKDGGRMFINVRGKDVLNSSGKIAINEKLMEYFIPRTAKTGSYQKGFTANELKAYLEDALGEGYTVEKTNKFGAVSAIVTKAGAKASRDTEYEELAKYPNKNEAKLQKMVDDKAKEAGYNTETPLYHGTGSFGFTEFDLSKMDDKRSIFTTDNDEVAESYSGKNGARRISDAKKPVNKQSKPSEIADALTASTYGDSVYVAVDSKEKARLLREKRSDIEFYIDDIMEFYADNEGMFNEEKTNLLLDIREDIENIMKAKNPNQVKSALNSYTDHVWDMKWMDEDVQMQLFASYAHAKGGAPLNELINKAAKRISSLLADGDAYICMTGPFYGSIMSTDEAISWIKSSPTSQPGIYKLYGNKGRSITIDCDGCKWNRIDGRHIGKSSAFVTTREVSEWAQNNGYDSVTFHDIVDIGSFSSKNTPSDVTIFFDPSQVKSADPVTYNNNGEIIPLSERFNPKSTDIRFSREESPEWRQNLDKMAEDYGKMPAGENPQREISMPNKTSDNRKLSMTVRTILEAKATPDTMVDTIEQLAEKGDFSYEAYGDKQAIKDAESRVTDAGWDKSLELWKKSVQSGKVSKKNTALGWALYNNAANSGNTDTAIDILNNMVEHQRNAAQALQATRILKKMNPETQLYGAARSVRNLQEELNERYGEENAPKLEIDQGLAEHFMKAKNDSERAEALKDIYRDIGRQMPSRFIDKVNAWRYLAMLGNARTHFRNVIGNAGFAPVVAVKDLTATAIESIVSRTANIERTKAIVSGKGGKELLSAAWNDYANISEDAMGGGKYTDLVNANKYIEEGKRIFGTSKDDLWNKTGGKALETARRKNGELLDKEDQWFSQPHYAYALAQYCKANGITAEQIAKGGKALEKARAYAIKEAQKATYRDTNDFSQFISNLGRSRMMSKNRLTKGVSMLVEGILPFRKTPANILARGMEYSPLGLIKSLSYDLNQVKNGKMDAAEAIDNISAGLTGTGLLALGVFLSSLGLVRGKGDDDEKENEFEDLLGHQNYALELPNGKSVTLDWLAPEALPFFVGTNLWEQTGKIGEGVTLDTVLTAITDVSEPLLEMSCLQSLNDLFESYGYSKGKNGLTRTIVSGATSYLTQFVPTIFGQIERSLQENRMTTYTNKTGFLNNTDLQYLIGGVSAKIPGWDYRQIEYIDAWGRTESSGGFVKRALNNFLNPAYSSEITVSDMENELIRLYEATGENVFPSRADKYFTVDKQRKDLTEEEYVEYAKQKGETSYAVATSMTGSSAYKKLSDADKAKAINEAYSYANQIAKKKVGGYAPESWVTEAKTAYEKHGVPIATYILIKTELSGVEAIKGKDGKSISNSKGLRIMQKIYNNYPSLTKSQRDYLFGCFDVGKTVIGYSKSEVEGALKDMKTK